jgi:dTDP-glucose 4,6-dehydratase
MKVLVTGGAGFIGSNFVRRAVQGFYPEIKSVKVLDKLTYAGNLENLHDVRDEANFEFIKGDICDSNLTSKLLNDIDAVLNFAAESHVDRSINSSKEFVITNILGVQNLLDSVLNLNKKIRYLQVSTDEVYGSISEGSWDEKYPVAPNSPYSASKASADLFVRSYFKTHGLDTVITRCSNNYGPYQYPEKLIPLFITNLLEDKKVPIYGEGLNVRDWLHVNDHCDGIYLALIKGESGEIYNIGGGLELTNKEITSRILELMGKNDSYIEYVEDRKGHDKRYSINCDKISSQLGYKSKVSFSSGIKDTVDWYLAHKSWWEPLKSK